MISPASFILTSKNQTLVTPEKTYVLIDFWLRPITITSAEYFFAVSQIVRPVSPRF